MQELIWQVVWRVWVLFSLNYTFEFRICFSLKKEAIALRIPLVISSSPPPMMLTFCTQIYISTLLSSCPSIWFGLLILLLIFMTSVTIVSQLYFFVHFSGGFVFRWPPIVAVLTIVIIVSFGLWVCLWQRKKLKRILGMHSLFHLDDDNKILKVRSNQAEWIGRR